MKKFLSFVLIFGLILTFAGCGTDTDTTVSSNMGDVDEIIAEDDVLTPIYASALEDGIYPITVDSNASMFRVVECELIVENGEMQAIMTMSGDGYGMVYMGTSEEALADSEENYVPFVLDEVGAKTFTVPVEALDMELNCAAWSIKKEKWYDRVLIFQSDELPAGALIEE